MTGMPSFAHAGAKDDDIWKIVAFLKMLPTVKEADYKAWTAPLPAPAPAAAPQPNQPAPVAAPQPNPPVATPALLPPAQNQ